MLWWANEGSVKMLEAVESGVALLATELVDGFIAVVVLLGVPAVVVVATVAAMPASSATTVAVETATASTCSHVSRRTGSTMQEIHPLFLAH